MHVAPQLLLQLFFQMAYNKPAGTYYILITKPEEQNEPPPR